METGKGSRLSLSRKRKKGSEDGISGSFVDTPNKSELACQIKEENTVSKETISNSTSSCEKDPKAAIILERREENSSETKKGIAAWLTKSHKPRTVPCPVCDKLVLLSTINRHLDSNCESDMSGKSQEVSNQKSRSSKVNGTLKGDKENAVVLPSKENVMESKECKDEGRLTQTNESLFPSKNTLNVGNVDFPCEKVRTRGEHSNKSVKLLKNDDHSSFEEIFEQDFHGFLTNTAKGDCSVAELSSKGKAAEFVIANEESELEEKDMQTTPGLHKEQDLSKNSTNSDKSVDDNEEHEEKELENQVGELQNYEPYYLANFKLVLNNVMSNEDDRQLFNEQDNEVIDLFNAMSPEEQKLYIRLFQRKRGWFRCGKLDYPKICKDLKPVTDLLIEKGFLQDESQLINLQEALNLIAAPELKLLVKSLHISPGKKGGTKEELIETIVNLAENQKTIFGSFRSVVLKRTREVLGSCVRVAPIPREVFSRVLLLFTMNVIPDDEDTASNGQAQLLSTLFLANIGKVVYPSYLIDRPTPVFHSRESLVAFTDAFQQKHEMFMALESNNFELAYSFYPEACKKFNDVLIKLKDNQPEQAVAAAHLPEHLRCFSAEWAITKMCYFGVEVMQKWRQYEEAVDQLEKLLEQDVFCFDSRGRWYDRLALNLHQHLKRPEKALEVIRQGLSDPHVRFGRRLALVQRAKRILSSPAFQKGKKKNCEDFSDLDLKEPSPCKCITISGTRCAELGVFIAPEISQDGVVNHDTKTFCAVEEYALSYYRQNGFDQGIHGEGSTFSSLFCLFMWDIIFTSGIPDVFRSPFQAAPLDMCFDSFYANRKEIIDRRLEEIIRAPVQKLQEMLLASWNGNDGQVCAGLSWERFRDVEQAKQLVACLGGAVLSGIFTRFAQGYRYYRSGLPDLVVWNSSSLDYRVVTALRYFASGSFLKVVADTMGISKASASRCVHSVTQCLKIITRDWIVFPTSREEMNVIIDIKFNHSPAKVLTVK